MGGSKKARHNKRQQKQRRRAARVKSRARREAVKKPRPPGDDAEIERLPALPDRRAMEGAMFRMFGNASGRSSDEVAEAQQLMYAAWESQSPKRRIALAREALQISPDCADAYNLLAEEAATGLEEATQLYRDAVAAGERALGPAAFEEDVGHFWAALETRPYMRAREGLARCLWTGGRREEAVEHYREMLRLNPSDNQGIRHTLAACLLGLGCDEELASLLRDYEDDVTAVWSYSAALLAFRAEGDTAHARKLLSHAGESNPYVPAFLTGKKKLPRQLPRYISFGDESEAMAYATEHGEAWRNTAGALQWLEVNTS